MLVITRHLISAIALILSICTPLHFADANETEFASHDSVDSTYSFYGGTKVRIRASGTTNDNYGLGVLQLKEFKVFWNSQRVDKKRFDELTATLGVKLGTIEVSRDAFGLTPETTRTLYAITFDYEAQAYTSLEAYPFEKRKHLRIEFDKTGVKHVVSTGTVPKIGPMD